MNGRRLVLRFVVYLLLLQGISSIWEFTEVAMYGGSQQSVVDTFAAIFMALRLDDRIWGEDW